MKKILVFVHGWSVTNIDTYGALPTRLREEGKKNGINIEVQEIFLGKYISFHDEVRLEDISKAFSTAVREELSPSLQNGNRFICITHSTGAPVIRDWWSRYYNNATSLQCPMSHLIMLAPANHGSALAQLGKGTLSRIKSWFDGVEPGQGVLDWLELGSRDAWKLNKEWIISDGAQIGEKGIFPFVLIGQSIDRSLYDVLNNYTGELGSDGVVRSAAANLNGRYIRLVEEAPVKNAKGILAADHLVVDDAGSAIAPPTAFRIVRGKSHSGEDMGIMRSVKTATTDRKSAETVGAIMDCIKVTDVPSYDALCKKFDTETQQVQVDELVETKRQFLISKRHFIHDKFSMVIFKVVDTAGYAIKDYDLLLTGEKSDPNRLPEGFFADRQRNKGNPETLTYFFNHNVMHGFPAVKDPDNGDELRPKLDGMTKLGLEIRPRPDKGFVRYLTCSISASRELFEQAIEENRTNLIEIVLQRVVDKEVFTLQKLGANQSMPIDDDFSKAGPSDEMAE